eukprot:COSAG05_NODE_755_length_7517_cov_61.549609_1_plen_93_part_00
MSSDDIFRIGRKFSATFTAHMHVFCKIFFDDQEMATNQKIGLCDYLRLTTCGPSGYLVRGISTRSSRAKLRVMALKKLVSSLLQCRSSRRIT